MALIRTLASIILIGFLFVDLNAQVSTLDNPYGIAGHGHYWAEVDSTNVKWARMWSQDGAALWGKVQPTHIDSFYWDDLDAWVNEIHAEGYHMMLKIRTGGDSTSFHPCKWTDHSQDPDVHPTLPPTFILYKEASFPPSDYQEWYDFVYAIVERYDGNHTDANGDTLPAITHFETQAENDIATYWYGTKQEYYDQFLPTFYRAVHDADQNAIVIGGSVTGAGIGLAIIDSMIKTNIDTAIIVDFYHNFFYESDNKTWSDIVAENTAAQRRIGFVNYSFKPYNDTVYYDKRGFHNYERWNTLKDHMVFERNQMSAYGYSRPLWGTEVGIYDPATFPLVPEHIHAQQYLKKMIFQFVENVEWFCFAPMTSNPNNFLTKIFSPMYSLIPFGTPLARELRDAFAFVAGKINEVTGYYFDHGDTVINVSIYYFVSSLSNKTLIAAWAQKGDTSTATIDIPDNLDSLVVYNYLGNPSWPPYGDSLTIVYTESPVFIEWIPSTISGVFESNNVNSDVSVINIYPNPTSGKVSLKFGNTLKEVDITVRNIVGQEILTNNFKLTNEISFEIKGPHGLYLVEIKTDDGESTMMKVIKD